MVFKPLRPPPPPPTSLVVCPFSLLSCLWAEEGRRRRGHPLHKATVNCGRKSERPLPSPSLPTPLQFATVNLRRAGTRRSNNNNSNVAISGEVSTGGGEEEEPRSQQVGRGGGRAEEEASSSSHGVSGFWNCTGIGRKGARFHRLIILLFLPPVFGGSNATEREKSIFRRCCFLLLLLLLLPRLEFPIRKYFSPGTEATPKPKPPPPSKQTLPQPYTATHLSGVCIFAHVQNSLLPPSSVHWHIPIRKNWRETKKNLSRPRPSS